MKVDDRTGAIREAADAAVLIETDDLVVRGPARISVPRASITGVRSRAGVVTVTSSSATVTLFLDDRADTWQARLAEAPKRLIDKLDARDNFGLVAFDDTVQVVVPAGKLSEKRRAKQALAGIRAGGSTDLSAGYLRGLQEAQRVAGKGGLPRGLGRHGRFGSATRVGVLHDHARGAAQVARDRGRR